MSKLKFKMQIRVIGLIPYVIHYLRTESLIAYAVFSNGLLYHAIAPENVLIKWYDIFCNTCIVIYVNIYVMNLCVFLWSCTAGACFIWNSIYIKHEHLKAIFHIVGVQLPLYRALQLSNF